MIRIELKKYIENVIFKEYEKNDIGHGIEHIKYVIRRSLKFAEKIEDINMEMVYVIAAYHDIGHHIDAKNHEKISAEMLLNDEKLKEFFTDEEINIMSIAVEDHRSSSDIIPRNIYGKIVSSADRNVSVSKTLERCYFYNLKHNPNLSEDDIIEICRLFLLKKYGINGYARDKNFFDDDEYMKYLDELTALASNQEDFKKQIAIIKDNH
ncbi:MAG: HD domain-containing protein [Bacilli bacterium]|nr:HD domain-containing protein [Bacilli bacterium]